MVAGSVEVGRSKQVEEYIWMSRVEGMKNKDKTRPVKTWVTGRGTRNRSTISTIPNRQQ